MKRLNSLAAMLAALCPAAALPHEVPARVEEVLILGNAARINAPGSLKDEIVKTESIDAHTLERNNAANITEALDLRPGIAVQVECSVCNVRNITLNNLPGRFTTLLIDGIPLYSSVSSAYGLDSVNVRGIEHIDIARGAGASLIAPEALSGTVDIITKRPSQAETVVRAQAGSGGAVGVDAYLARPFAGGALSFSLDSRAQDPVDGVGLGMSQYAGFKRTLMGLGGFFDDVGGFRLKSRLDVVDEKRYGGVTSMNDAAIKNSNTGNPFDFSRGAHASPDPAGWVAPDGVSGPDTLASGQNGWRYRDGAAGFAQIIATQRQQATLIAERNLGIGRLRLAAGLAHHFQDSFYGGDATYRADQHQSYLETSYRMPLGGGSLTLGASYRYEDLKSRGYSFVTGSANDGIDNYSYRTPALFVQVYRPFLENRLESNFSLRTDRHNVFGTIASPRLNLLFHHDDQYASRLSLGRGFRAPTSFFEQEHGILADGRIVRDVKRPELSDNLSYALSYASDRWSWVGSANYNRIRNFARLTPGQPDPMGGASTVTLFDSAPDPVTIKGLDWIGTYRLTPSTTASLGVEKFSYDFTPGTLNFARPERRVYLETDSEFGDWDINAKITWTGRQHLAKFYDYVDTPRYNLDGSPKPDWSPAYYVVDLRAQLRLDATWALFAGVNNLFDYQQAKHDSYLWLDRSGGVDVTHIWGPNRGRTIYAGVRLSL